MDIQAFIAERRDNRPHSEAELREFSRLVGQQQVPDYQISAWLMAAYLNPLSMEETAWLTVGMADSGQRLDLTGIAKPWFDKHSTGGVGDKTTIALIPILAACGLTVAKMSGRGLGITGGTVDKLGAIPGFHTDLSSTQMVDQAARIGIALTGQSYDLAPADKLLYSLRDTTATVGSLPLIVSSILSKKLAGGAESILLDVKAGSGAFMKTLPEAKALATALLQTANKCGMNCKVVLTDMTQPLGSAVGNALEVKEAVMVLRGDDLIPTAQRFRSFCIEIGARALVASGKVSSIEMGQASVTSVLESGAAAQKAKDWFEAQGATADVITNPEVLVDANYKRTVKATKAGYISLMDAQAIGEAVVQLGGGRQKKEDSIDLSVGMLVMKAVGDRVEVGDALVEIHARNEADATSAIQRIMNKIEISAEPGSNQPMIIEEIS